MHAQPNPSAPDADLAHVLAHTRDIWAAARGHRIFVTGATGFFGAWLLQTFVHANRVLELGAELIALKLPHEDLTNCAPHLAGLPGVVFVNGDVRTLRAEDLAAQLPSGMALSFTYVIHAAIFVDAATYSAEPLATLDSALLGTRQTLEVSRAAGARRVLLTSSGAIYGRQPADLEMIPEEYSGGPDPAAAISAYAEGKRASETLCACYQQTHGIEAVFARCFAFVGPHLPIDRQFAIGNFIRDALRGGPVKILGDGTPLRSYLYAADLAIWLWTLLFRGTAGRVYNVGSDVPVSILEVARLVSAGCDPAPQVEVHGIPNSEVAPDRYVPSIARARAELGLTIRIELEDAIARTLRWHADRGAP